MKKGYRGFFCKNTTLVKGISVFCYVLVFLISGQVMSHNHTVVRGERPPIDLGSVPEDAYEKGVIRIKFDEGIDVSTLGVNITAEGFVSFGFPAVDALHHLYAVSEARMTFGSPAIAGKYAERHRSWGLYHWYDLYVDENTDIIEMVKRYAQLEEIVVAEPHYKKELIGFVENMGDKLPDHHNDTSRQFADTDSLFFPDDPQFEDQWHYHNTGQTSGTPGADISLPAAWAIETGHPDVIVAVIDGGIAINHPDLADNIWEGVGYNFVNDSPIISPHNHGSHVAGTIAAVNNNDTGVSGIAGGWGALPGVQLMSAQVFVDDGFFGQSGGFEIAPIYAADNGAAISQNSWGYNQPGHYEQAVLDAIDYFNANGGGDVMNGGLTIFAAGNDGNDAPKYPAYYSGAMAVASTNHNDQLSWYSNYGIHVDISAPGGETNVETEQGVLSTRNTGYGYAQGTSMACPHVSGVVALMISMAPGVLDASEVSDLLLNSTEHIDEINPDYANLMGTGRLNAHAALLATAAYAADPSAPAPPTEFSVTADPEGDFAATLSWINPSMAAGGDTLDELDAIHIYRGDSLIHILDDPVIDEESTYMDDTMSENGIYGYTVRGVNNAGTGQPAMAQAFVGHDVPAAPTEAQVEALGNSALISWKVPVNGFHDGFLDGENLRYDIRRYPCDTLIASEVTDTIFFDATIPEFASYYYIINAMNDLGQGGAASTNDAFLGISTLLLYEPFDYEPGSLPPDWIIQGDGQSNWGVNDSQTAGGDAPEMRLNSDPIFSGTSELISHTVDVAGQDQLKYTFRSHLNNNGMMNGAGEIWAGYSTDQGASWTELMAYDGTGDYGPTLEEFLIHIPQGADSIQLAFGWEGITWHISNWSIDNIILYPFGDNFEAMIILRDESGNRLSGATVMLGDNTATEVIPGGYFFEEMPAGIHTLLIEKDGYENHESDIEITDSTIFETIVLIEHLYTVSFDVIATDDNPVPDATITLDNHTNPAGDYVFEHIAAGTRDYMVEREGFHTVEGAVEVNDDTTVPVVMEWITYQVAFTVEDQQGQAIDNAVITLGGMENDPGDYLFEDVMPDAYAYTVEKDGYHTVEGAVTVDEDISLTVMMELITYQVLFSVEDQQGQAIDNAVITLGGMENDPGDYLFEYIVPGAYDYLVEKENYHDVSGELLVSDYDITKNISLEEDDVFAAAPDTGNLIIYPNPASDKITVSSEIKIKQINLIDLLGQQVLVIFTDEFTVEVDVSYLHDGIYLIQVGTEDKIFTRRLQVIE